MIFILHRTDYYDKECFFERIRKLFKKYTVPLSKYEVATKQ